MILFRTLEATNHVTLIRAVMPVITAERSAGVAINWAKICDANCSKLWSSVIFLTDYAKQYSDFGMSSNFGQTRHCRRHLARRIR